MSRISEKKLIIIISAAAAALLIAAIILCACIFVRADRLSHEARILDRAVTESASVAETLKASGGDLQTAGRLMRAHKLYDISDSTLTLYYDDELNPANRADSPYKAVISMTPDGNRIAYEINIQDAASGSRVYRLSFDYIQTGGDR